MVVPIEGCPMADDQPWFQNRRGRGLVLLYLVFTLVGVGLSVGWGDGLSLSIPSEVTVPSFVYLYGFLGALAYAFTSLLTEFDKPTRDLLQVGLRIPAALLLATGVYLLAAFFVSDPSTRVVAGLSFLVGLYVKLTLEALGSLARRLYGMGSGSAPPEEEKVAEAVDGDGEDAERSDGADGTGATDGTAGSAGADDPDRIEGSVDRTGPRDPTGSAESDR